MNKTSLVKVLLSVIILILLLMACQSTSLGYVDSFERFVERVEKNASSYSKEQWEKNDEQLNKYVERYKTEKAKLSTDEKREVGRLTVRYYKARVKSFGHNIFGEIGDWLDYIKGFADEIKEDIENYQNQ